MATVTISQIYRSFQSRREAASQYSGSRQRNLQITGERHPGYRSRSRHALALKCTLSQRFHNVIVLPSVRAVAGAPLLSSRYVWSSLPSIGPCWLQIYPAKVTTAIAVDAVTIFGWGNPSVRQLLGTCATSAYAQCGGLECPGPYTCADAAGACCPAGYTCTRGNAYYWQCTPSPSTAASTPAATTGTHASRFAQDP